MITATKVSIIEEMQSFLEQVGPGKPERLNAAASNNDGVRQGDLYLKVVAQVPPGYKKVKRLTAASKQLVPGQTRGAKHCLDSLSGVELFLPEVWNEESLLGPCLVLTEERKVLHPVHGSVTIDAGVTVLCRYQRVYDLEQKKERRARD